MCVVFACTRVTMCVVFACTRVGMRASIHIEMLNCACMNCVTHIRNLFNLIGIYNNLV